MPLYIVSIPIGNLKDLTFRALETLQKVDYVLCEDKRKAQFLLSSYNLKKPLVLFHEFCEKKQEDKVLQDLKEEKEIALISDAGTPLINDPGSSLLQKILQENLPFEVIPGVSSVITALSISGFSTSRFQFVGFFPKKKEAKKRLLKQMLFFEGTSIAFESPHRIISTLEELKTLCEEAEVALARELTKKYEECLRGTSSSLLEHLMKKPPKGEFVFLLKGGKKTENLSLEELSAFFQEEMGLSFKESLKEAKKRLKKKA